MSLTTRVRNSHGKCSMQNVQMPEQNFMMLKSTFDLFDRDGGGEVDTDEVTLTFVCVHDMRRRVRPRICN